MISIATPVIYYPHGERDNPPIAAIVTFATKDNVADLVIFHRNGDTAPRRSIHHIDSRFLRNEEGQLTDGARRSGAWDYHPSAVLGDLDGIVEGEDGEESKLETKISARHKYSFDERQEKCRELMDLPFAKAFAKARFWGVTKSELQVFFEKAGKLCNSANVAEAAGAL